MHNFLEPAKVAPCISTWAAGRWGKVVTFQFRKPTGDAWFSGRILGGSSGRGGSGKLPKQGSLQWTLGPRTDGGPLENFSTCPSLPSLKSQCSSQLVLVHTVPVTQWSSKFGREPTVLPENLLVVYIPRPPSLDLLHWNSGQGLRGGQ